MLKKILIDLDVLTIAEWEKKDPRKKEAIDFLKRVEKKNFYTYVVDEQFKAVSKWENKNLSRKVTRRLIEIKDVEEDATDLLEMLKLEIGRELEEFLDEFVRFTQSKRSDLRLVLIASALEVGYLVTFNRKHLKRKEKSITEFLKKYNLHTPKIVLPGEILSDSRIKSFSFSHLSYNNSFHLLFSPFSQLIRSLKLSHSIEVSSSLFKVFGLNESENKYVKMNKGISPLISMIFVILLTIVAIAIILTIGLPAMEKGKEAAVLNEAMQNMKAIANVVKEVASEGVGSLRNIQLKVTDGEYKINQKANSIDFTFTTKSKIVQPGSFIREGDITLSAGANAKAYEQDLDGDGLTDLVLENEILRIGILKVGSKNNPDFIDTGNLIKIINFKETGANVTPTNSSIVLDDYEESSYGKGYSELVREDDNLAKAEAVVHMNTTFVNYDILYTLQSGADFIIVKIQNAYYKPSPQYVPKVIFSDGFESGDFSAWTGTAGSPSVISTTSRHGTYSAQGSASGDWWYKQPINSGANPFYIRWYMKFSSVPSNDNDWARFMVVRNSTGELIAELSVIKVSGQLKLRLTRYFPSSSDLDYNYNFQANEWYCFEIKFYNHASSGEHRVWLDGTEVITDSGIDTSSGGTADRIWTGNHYSNYAVTVYGDSYVVANKYIGC